MSFEKVDEIKTKLAELGLSLHGNKAELKERLMHHLYGEDTGDADESEVEHTVELPDMTTAQVAQTERKRRRGDRKNITALRMRLVELDGVASRLLATNDCLDRARKTYHDACGNWDLGHA